MVSPTYLHIPATLIVVSVSFKYSLKVNIYSVPRIMPDPGNTKKQLENSDVDSFTQRVKC